MGVLQFIEFLMKKREKLQNKNEIKTVKKPIFMMAKSIEINAL